MRSDPDTPQPAAAEETIQRAAEDLETKMRKLKTRFREERRKLETRSFDPPSED